MDSNKSKWCFHIRCAWCGTWSFRKIITALVCYKCYWHKNTPNYLRK